MECVVPDLLKLVSGIRVLIGVVLHGQLSVGLGKVRVVQMGQSQLGPPDCLFLVVISYDVLLWFLLGRTKLQE